MARAGSRTTSSDVQVENAQAPTLASVAGSLIAASPVQPMKAAGPRRVYPHAARH